MSFIVAVVKADGAAIIYCKRAIRSWSNCSIGTAVAAAVVVVDWVVVIFKKKKSKTNTVKYRH